jgi:hypothetical protein
MKENVEDKIDRDFILGFLIEDMLWYIHRNEMLSEPNFWRAVDLI